MTKVYNTYLQRRFRILPDTGNGYVRLFPLVKRFDKRGYWIPEGETWVEQKTFEDKVANGCYVVEA